MDSYIPDLESTAVKVGLAFQAYRGGTVRVVESDWRRFTHLVASRQGLYGISETEVVLVVHGFFFGVTVRGKEVFVFECCDLPRGPTRHGRLLKFVLRAGCVAESHILVQGLDNGCHQIDFIDGRLQVLDTYNQCVLDFEPGEQTYRTLYPLPRSPDDRWTGQDAGYRHVNSLLAVGDRTLLLLHNGAQHTGRCSELAVFDRGWRELDRIALRGSGCHGLALLEDGTVLTCGSMEGNLISAAGWRLRVSPNLTRGLSVGVDSVVVGASQLVERENRLRNSGTVTFMDRDYTVRTVLEVPGAPTEIRRLDGQDAGLSGYLAAVPWGSTLNLGKVP